MQNNDCISSSFRINHIVVDGELGCLNINGQQVKIEPRAMELLTYLVANHGKVCSKADIAAALWPRQHISDEVITRLIFVLRSSMGDNAKDPQFISTVAKKGYVFLIPPKQIRKYNFKLLLFVVLMIIVSFYYLIPSSTTYSVLKQLPVTHSDGLEYSFTKSEAQLAWLYKNEKYSSIVVNNAGKKTEFALDNWQKRGLTIVGDFFHYIRFNAFEYQIVRQTLKGEAEVLVASDKPIFSLLYDSSTQLFIYNQYKNNDRVYLRQYSLVSNKESNYLPAKQDWPDNLYLPELSRDGQVLYYVGIESKQPIVYMSEKSDSARPIIAGFTEVTGLAVGESSSDLFIAGKRNFRTGIWWVDSNTDDISLLHSFNEGDISDLYYDVSSNALYYSSSQTRVDINQIDFNNRVDDLAKVNSSKQESSARYLPSDNQLYFASNRTGYAELYQFSQPTMQVEKITNINASNIWYYSLSGDGKKLAIVYSTDKIYLSTIETKTMKALVTIELEDIKFPLSWSDDNQYIYVSEHLENIAMYRYKADDLSIVNERLHLGLSAVELNEGKIIAFDYVSARFVSYHFDSDSFTPLSSVVDEHMTLSPNKAKVMKDNALLVFEDGSHKKVFKFGFNKSSREEEPSLIAELLFSGSINTFNTKSDGLVFSSMKNIQGDVEKLELISK